MLKQSLLWGENELFLKMKAGDIHIFLIVNTACGKNNNCEVIQHTSKPSFAAKKLVKISPPT